MRIPSPAAVKSRARRAEPWFRGWCFRFSFQGVGGTCRALVSSWPTEQAVGKPWLPSPMPVYSKAPRGLRYAPLHALASERVSQCTMATLAIKGRFLRARSRARARALSLPPTGGGPRPSPIDASASALPLSLSLSISAVGIPASWNVSHTFSVSARSRVWGSRNRSLKPKPQWHREPALAPAHCQHQHCEGGLQCARGGSPACSRESAMRTHRRQIALSPSHAHTPPRTCISPVTEIRGFAGVRGVRECYSWRAGGTEGPCAA